MAPSRCVLYLNTSDYILCRGLYLSLSLSLIISSLCLLSEQLHYLLISILVAGSYTIVVWNIDQSEANTIEI